MLKVVANFVSWRWMRSRGSVQQGMVRCFVSWFLSHDFCRIFFEKGFFKLSHEVFWSLKLSYCIGTWDFSHDWIQVRWELFSAHVLMRRGDLRKKRETGEEVVVVKSVGFWTFVWTARGPHSLGISGSDVRLRSFLLAPKCPLERRLATRFLGRSWALEVSW